MKSEYIAVVCLNVLDFKNFLVENNIKSKIRKTIKVFDSEEDNKTYICYSSPCDIISFNIDSYVLTTQSVHNENLKLMMDLLLPTIKK